ncbi:MAG: HPF/RaiA family ribosome-associated protein [Geminicoccaceae bacterium]|nr:HPF/RaiA family ribosome-associated protein [Geminicoccaceae bacterium]
MDEPLEIAFHNLQASESVEAAIRDRFAKLEKLYDRLTACRVSVEALHKQHRTGNVYEVHIDMLVPGGEVVVTKAPQKARERYANPDVYASIRDAFDAAERQLLAYKEQLGGGVKYHSADQVQVQGQVAEMHADEDYGYILGTEGALIYFHRNSVLDGSFDGLGRGAAVLYVHGQGDTGPTAVKVWQDTRGK